MSAHLNEVFLREWRRGNEHLGVVGSDSLLAIAFTLSQAEAPELLEMPRLIITATDDDARRMCQAIHFFNPTISCFSLGGHEVTPYLGLDPSPKSLVERLQFLWKAQNPGKTDIFVASLPQLSIRAIPYSTLRKKTIRLRAGGTIPDGFLEMLQDWGYQREPLVEDVGQFSARGGIIDVFAPSMAAPVRIELFDDQIDSLRSFAPENQRSIDPLTEIALIPAREVFFADIDTDAVMSTLTKDGVLPPAGSAERETLVRALNSKNRFAGMDFLAKYFFGKTEPVHEHFSGPLQVWLVNPDECIKALDIFQQEIQEGHRAANELVLKVPPAALYLTWDDFKWPEGSRLIEFSNLVETLPDEEKIPTIDYRSQGLKELRQSLSAHPPWSNAWTRGLVDKIKLWKSQRLAVFLSIENQSVAKKMQTALEQEGLLARGTEENAWDWPLWRDDQRGTAELLHILPRSSPESVRLPTDELIVIQDDLLIGRRARKKTKTAAEEFQSSARTLSFGDLQIGDCIVHNLHGVGVYEGLKRLSIDGIENEFLQLSYKDKDRLYLPVYRFNQIQKYAGRSATTVLDKLGGPGWEKTKAKARTGARDLALELLSLYAKRAESRRPPLPIDDAKVAAFESHFPYDETDDQLRAIADIEKDLTGDRPMDRLICGDVGFGKTEVAMRAAFMVASTGKQVLVLAPTTVLVFQHLETFRKRFQGTDLEIRALNRFVSPAETKETTKLFKEGKVNILIGTHRLLSRDVEVADLGLLIIDEEQRFGVAHKERIRKLKAAVDTLAMSATPIPRSLNMSLVSIRDLSLINTAPVDRLPTRTFIIKWNETTIRNAILTEIKRGGQVYFVHNRVQSIYSLADEIRAAVPEARIKIGHGQMQDEELEKTMVSFFHKEIDVLISTTIVESGMDVPAANTIFIDQAHSLGLSQLYQLRGRVGRSKQRAFCYLLTPKGQNIDKTAQERLKVIHDNTALGSGIRIAQYDLELRGAGEILGDQQSGHLNAVGYEMYMDLLAEEIDKLRGNKTTAAEVEPEINLRMQALIPEGYIPDIRVRLSYYKALSEIKSEAELEQIESDLKDQFGPLPDATLNLFGVMLIRQKCKLLGIKDVSTGMKNVSLVFTPHSPLKTEEIVRLATKENKKYSITPDSRLNIRLQNLTWTNVLQELTLLEKRV